MSPHYVLEVRIVEVDGKERKPVELSSGQVKDSIPLGSRKQGLDLLNLLGVLYTTEPAIRETIPDYLKLVQKMRNAFDSGENYSK